MRYSCCSYRTENRRTEKTMRYDIIIIIINHIALSCNSYGKLPQLYYSTVLARNKVASGYPSAVIFHACEQASVFSLDSRSKTSDREPYLAHDPLDQRGLWAFRPPEP